MRRRPRVRQLPSAARWICLVRRFAGWSPLAVLLGHVHPLRSGPELEGDRVHHLPVGPPSATPFRSPVRE